MATVKTIIEKAYTKVNGEYELLAEGSDDFRTYLNVLNQVMEQWADTPYVKWQSLYNANYKLPTKVANGVLTYNIPDEVIVGNTPFDSVYFVADSGLTVERYKMTDQALFDSTTAPNVCALFGDELHLKSLADDIIGTSIRLPAYVRPEIYTLGSQAVKIDNVSWLIAAMAAFICDASPVPFIARNAEKYAKEASVFMKTMKANNKRRQHLTIKRAQQTIDDQRFGALSQAINAGVGVGGGTITAVDGGEF